MISEFKSGTLLASSEKGNDVTSMFKDHYDLTLIVSSWDERCLSILKCEKLTSDCGIGVYFKNKDAYGLRDKHDKKIKSFLKRKCQRYEECVTHSLNYDHTWKELFGKVLSVYSKIERPMHLLIDLTTCPRYYSLGIIATCLKLGIIETISVMYTEGIYTEDERNSEPRYVFTDGKWDAVSIPSLEGETYGQLNKYYIISVGFEGNKTLRAIHSVEPDRISILFPQPGVKPEYVTVAREENELLINRYCVPSTEIVKARAGDAIEAWSKLSKFRMELEKENVFFLCCGTKAHSLALVLRAVELGHPRVLYNCPTEHKVVDIVPSGVYWKYCIEDLSVLSSEK